MVTVGSGSKVDHCLIPGNGQQIRNGASNTKFHNFCCYARPLNGIWKVKGLSRNGSEEIM